MRTLQVNSFNHYKLVRHEDGSVEVLEYGAECPRMGDSGGYTNEKSLGKFGWEERVQWDGGKGMVYKTVFKDLSVSDEPDCGDDFLRSLCVADPDKELFGDYYKDED